MAESHSDAEITEEEFEQWLSPPLALKFLTHLSRADAIDAILFRIASKSLDARAEVTILKRGGSERQVLRHLIPLDFWKSSAANQHAHLFWDTGDIAAKIVGYPSDTEARGLNIRFDPAGLSRMLPQKPPVAKISIPPGSLTDLVNALGLEMGALQNRILYAPLPPAAAPPAPPTHVGAISAIAGTQSETISNEQVRAWFSALSVEVQSLGYRRLWLMARQSLGSSVKRKQVEALCAGRSTGPKPRR